MRSIIILHVIFVTSTNGFLAGGTQKHLNEPLATPLYREPPANPDQQQQQTDSQKKLVPGKKQTKQGLLGLILTATGGQGLLQADVDLPRPGLQKDTGVGVATLQQTSPLPIKVGVQIFRDQAAQRLLHRGHMELGQHALCDVTAQRRLETLLLRQLRRRCIKHLLAPGTDHHPRPVQAELPRDLPTDPSAAPGYQGHFSRQQVLSEFTHVLLLMPTRPYAWTLNARRARLAAL